ncbi:MAG: methylated-DNA--[protein]-cysteine S-methyltransferase [Nitrospiraceae bacterium]
MTQQTLFKTQWGWMGIALSGKGVAAVVLSQPSRRAAEAALAEQNGVPKASAPYTLSREARAQILSYLQGRRRDFSLPLDLSSGTPFQRRVWKTILRIPYGRVRSYQWVAARVGGKQYARAVGMALGANPVPIVVPCHRIVAHDGSLGGFSCGLRVKRQLLQLEGTLPQLLKA